MRLHEELTADTWQPGSYTYFDIHEPKLRRVAAAPFRDRVVHHALVRVLEPIFEKKFIEDSYACRKGKGTHAGVRRCAEFTRRFPYVLKCDLRRYFPSIDHEILLQRIGKTIADRQVMALIRRILGTHEDGHRTEWGEDLLDCHIRRHGLPIGNLTSQFFANVHLDGFDHFVKQELGVKGYVRYVDDFLIFAESREQARAWGKQAREYLTDRRMEIHPDKCRHAVPGSGTSRMSRAVAEKCIGRIGKAPEAAGSASEGRLRRIAACSGENPGVFNAKFNCLLDAQIQFVERPRLSVAAVK